MLAGCRVAGLCCGQPPLVALSHWIYTSVRHSTRHAARCPACPCGALPVQHPCYTAGPTVRPEARSALQNTVFDTTSSFFWSSPWMLAAPARPVRLLMPLRFTCTCQKASSAACQHELLLLRGCRNHLACEACRLRGLDHAAGCCGAQAASCSVNGLLRGWQQPAPLTRLAICLQATAIDEMTVASSLSRWPEASSCRNQVWTVAHECLLAPELWHAGFNVLATLNPRCMHPDDRTTVSQYRACP
jgi:hypothetical protein